ncbi:hypothetical protein P152DRAFT_506163 [Eremomyces bilateralis CBS 781.70]|uniref:Zn(2)-C6 fungal-type domain-containing protein n=1 Tax=Eremomyces bilateralis CBS 781.70 TaxID=1392243 RepID=A0A6G1G8J4_9PEZI|nr:uncharacterized protein P152DRAFT_506163 [Eremomyces bilateralis CBS 781.70]KAF1814220.1 hypothetical protein P152DRAFT_506163 [Eremomyces bilateralis CBS 781.70]
MEDPEPFSPGSEDRHSGSKRKADSSGQQQRAKRNRYISIACNECKRRKIKCDGKTPCQRCGNLSLDCVYAPNCCTNFKDTEDFKRMQTNIDTLQQQVNTLFTNLTSLRDSVETSFNTLATNPVFSQPVDQRALPLPSLPSPSPNPPPSHKQRFRGPTSSAYNLGVANSSLQGMGIGASDEALEEAGITQDETPRASPHPRHAKSAMPMGKDPLWLLTREEAVRLVRVWQEEIGVMYPVLDVTQTLQHANNVYQFLEAAVKTGFSTTGWTGPDALVDPETILLKVVLATTLMLDSSGKSDIGKKLYDSIACYIEEQLTSSASLHNVRMLAVAAMYHFHRDDECLAWRIVGVAVRLCFELGLHRTETYHKQMTTYPERAVATRVFWSMYVLDKRWSFGCGLPFAMQDFDVDPRVLQPDGPPYLLAMIDYSRIGSKIWRSITNWDGAKATFNEREMGYLDYEILEWHRSLPESLKYLPPAAIPQSDRYSRVSRRLRIILLLRRNQMRILIYRPILHNTASIKDNIRHADTVVDIAKESLRILTEMSQKTELYSNGKVLFNYFLISAVAVLILAVCHAPQQYTSQVRDEFNMAVDLIRGFSANSGASKRLWKTLRNVKEASPKLGLNLSSRSGAGNQASDPHSDAAVAMAGLAGHPMNHASMLSTNLGMASQASSNSGMGNAVGANGMENSPNGMANDLTDLFEAAGGYSGLAQNGEFSSMVQPPGEMGQPQGTTLDRPGFMFGQEEEDLSNILRDLF